MIKQFILIVCVLQRLTSGVVINCDFSLQPLKTADGSPTRINLYTCIVKNLKVDVKDRIITDIIGVHLQGRSHTNIEQLIIENQEVKVMPQPIARFLPNLKIASITSSKLGGIEFGDLQGLLNLEQLFLGNNEIQVLLPNIFADNSRLTTISLRQNKLKGISVNMFASLPSLTGLFLDNNECLSGIVARATNANEILTLKTALSGACQLPSFIEGTLSSLVSQHQQCGNQIRQTELNLQTCIAGIIPAGLPASILAGLSGTGVPGSLPGVLGGLPGVPGSLPGVPGSLAGVLGGLPGVPGSLPGVPGGLPGITGGVPGGFSGVPSIIPIGNGSLILAGPDSSKKGTCNYILNNLDYVCNLNLKITAPDVLTVSISGTHEFGKSNIDLTSLIATNQIIRFVPQRLFVDVPNVKSVSITSSQLLAVTTKSFIGLPRLEDLKLSNNDLSFVDNQVFALNPLLVNIDLSRNKIDTISKCSFGGLKNLRVLSLAGNLLKRLPSNLFRGNLNLQTILLNDNKIARIPAMVFEPLSQLRFASLEGNVCINERFESVEKDFLGDILSNIGGIFSGLSLSGLTGVLGSENLLGGVTGGLAGNVLGGLGANLLGDGHLGGDLTGNILGGGHLGGFNFLGRRRSRSVSADLKVLSASINSLGYIIVEGAISVQILSEETDPAGNILSTIRDSVGNVIEVKTSVEGRIISSVVKSVVDVEVKGRRYGRQLFGLTAIPNLPSVSSLGAPLPALSLPKLPLKLPLHDQPHSFQNDAVSNLVGTISSTLSRPTGNLKPNGILFDPLPPVSAKINLGNVIKGTINKSGQIVIGGIGKSGGLLSGLVGGAVDSIFGDALGLFTTTIDVKGNIIINVANGLTGIELPIPSALVGTKVGLQVDADGSFAGVILNEVPSIKDVLKTKCIN